MKKKKFELAIKTGDEEVEALTVESLLPIFSGIARAICGETVKIGMKLLSQHDSSGNPRKPPKIRDEDIAEYEQDKQEKLEEFEQDLIADGYTTLDGSGPMQTTAIPKGDKK